jgi:1,4-dihydroxy-6-naphthoate synthase
MNLSLGFSTCPNDTFMFDAMVNGRIDTEGLTFDLTMGDIENLNQSAIENKVDVTKISYAVYPKISAEYQIINSGSALGHGNGPLLVSKTKIHTNEVKDLRIAIPGPNTTANLLLSIAFPENNKKTAYIFSDIEGIVLKGEADAGLLIHENRFTYETRGLQKIIDLGAWWEEHTKLPIPLGGIVVRRNLPEVIKQTINRVLHNSIAFAFEHPHASMDFVRQHAREMDDEVMKKHISLYVNEYSLDLGDKGRDAIAHLFQKALDVQKINQLTQPIFAI